MDDRKIDFAQLDPSTNVERWDLLVQSIADQALMRFRQRRTIPMQLLAWSRPALAVAAAAAVICSSIAALSARTSPTPSSLHPSFVVARWAALDEHPNVTYLVRVLGNAHE